MTNESVHSAGEAIPVPGPVPEGNPLAVSERGTGPYIRRFSRVQRITHALVIVSFMVLVITGVPLRFSAAPWAAPLMRMLGGAQVAGAVHRFCALITFGYFGLHLATLVRKLMRAEKKSSIFWGPESMVPQPKDIKDVIAQFKWFLGLGPRPRFDRFSYMEKFDYFGVFWGVAIIGGSGLLLWFPTFFSHFLPGWMFNVATVVHGDEALLALGFIFTVHFFNVHLRPEKFPIDLVIFTGSARAEYFKEEHPLEYERNVKEGRLEQLYVPAPSRAAYLTAVWLGFAALVVGLIVIGLVVYAVLTG
jgi:cytochrome b subunit of formate dehydrogenase